MKKIIYFIFIITLNIHSQNENGFQISITHENDFLSLNNEDENYTGGLNIELMLPEFNFWQPFFRLENSKNIQIISFGGTGYTPQNLGESLPIIEDRPYSSLVYLSLGKSSMSQDARKSLTSKLYIGVIGSSKPGKLQYFLHDRHFFGSQRPNPLGWHNQIGNEGSFVLNYNVRYFSQFSDNDDEKDRLNSFKTYWNAGVDVGNYMLNLQGGVFIDLLNLNDFPTLGVDNILIPTKKNIKGFNGGKMSHPKFRVSVFLSPFVRYVGYNSSLEGLLFNDNSVHTIPHNEINRVLFEFTAGVNILLWDSFNLKYTFTGRTQEFKGGKAIHYWGGITLGFSPKKWFRGK